MLDNPICRLLISYAFSEITGSIHYFLNLFPPRNLSVHFYILPLNFFPVFVSLCLFIATVVQKCGLSFSTQSISLEDGGLFFFLSDDWGTFFS